MRHWWVAVRRIFWSRAILAPHVGIHDYAPTWSVNLDLSFIVGLTGLSGQRRYLKPIGQAIRRECCTNSFENGPAAEMSDHCIEKGKPGAAELAGYLLLKRLHLPT